MIVFSYSSFYLFPSCLCVCVCVCDSDHLVNCMIIRSNCYSLRRGEKGKSEQATVKWERANEQVYIWTWDSFGHRSQVQVCFVSSSSSCLLHFCCSSRAIHRCNRWPMHTRTFDSVGGKSKSSARCSNSLLLSLSLSLTLSQFVFASFILPIHRCRIRETAKGEERKGEANGESIAYKYRCFVRGILLFLILSLFAIGFKVWSKVKRLNTDNAAAAAPAAPAYECFLSFPLLHTLLSSPACDRSFKSSMWVSRTVIGVTNLNVCIFKS